MFSWREDYHCPRANRFPLSHRPNGWKDRQATRLSLKGQRIYNYRLQAPQSPESELGRRKERNKEVSAWVLRAGRESRERLQGEASGNRIFGKLSLVGRGCAG